MAGKSKRRREADDEAWLRAQQVDLLTGSVERAAAPEAAHVPDIPDTCPGCGKTMTLESGWTFATGVNCVGRGEILQCGACALFVHVSDAAADRFRAALHAEFARRAAQLEPPKKDPARRRVRGAG